MDGAGEGDFYAGFGGHRLVIGGGMGGVGMGGVKVFTFLLVYRIESGRGP